MLDRRNHLGDSGVRWILGLAASGLALLIVLIELVGALPQQDVGHNFKSQLSLK